MNAIAEKYTEKKIGSIFLYTHEAHPGENYPHLTSMDQKYEHAKAIQEIYNVNRPIYLDSLDGACHRRYGSMPNMSWIFNRAGIPVFKSDWTDVTSGDLTIDYVLSLKNRRREGERIVPFKVERLDYRTQDHDGFQKGLAMSGPKAVKEFSEAF